MARPVTKKVKSFALKIETLARIREVTEEAKLAGGASALVESAVSSWLKRYDADPRGFLSSIGIAHTAEPTDDI